MSSDNLQFSSAKLRSTASVVSKSERPDIQDLDTAFTVQVIDCDRLDEELLQFWVGLHQNESQYSSPNFHPDFTKAVAKVRDDVRIGVIRHANGQLAGVFPFQKLSEHTADTVGGRMNDYHGVMHAPEVRIDLDSLLLKLGIKTFAFHAVSANKERFEDYQFVALPSFCIDLSDGCENYMNWAKGNSQTVKRMPQKIRAIARDHGSLRFEFDCQQSDVLEKVILMKRQKYNRTNTFDILSVEWAANLLREIHQVRNSDFRSLMSVLWAGDSIVAAHFGMISGEVLQYWFPVFDYRFSKYSPGIQLMMNTISQSCKTGISRIDLSYGQSKFKEMFANQDEEVLFGKVSINRLAFQVAKQRYLMRMRLKKLPLKEPAKYLLRKVFPGYGRWHFK